MQDSSLEMAIGTTRLGKKIIEVKDISVSLGGLKLVEGFTFTVTRDERLGILGSNGTGKTTLLKMLAGEIQPDSGEIQWGETVKIGFFKQETPFLDPMQRAIDYIKDGGEFITSSDGQKVSASQMMERFLFPRNHQYTPLGKLSGGEQRRLYLMRILMEAPNVLLMDEPTNDLDIDTLQILEEYLEDFPGPVIIVSHDRYLLDKLSEKLLIFQNGKIEEFTGNYDLFRSREKELEKDSAPKEKLEVRKEKVKAEKQKLSFTEQREWETIEDKISELEKAISKLDHEMELIASDFKRLQQLMEDKEKLEIEHDKLLDRWMYLSAFHLK